MQEITLLPVDVAPEAAERIRDRARRVLARQAARDRYGRVEQSFVRYLERPLALGFAIAWVVWSVWTAAALWMA